MQIVQDKKRVIENLFEEVWNKRNLDKISEVFSPSPIVHSPIGEYKTWPEMLQAVDNWISAFPDISVRILNMIEESDLVTSHWEMKATHQSDLNGIPATGKPVKCQGVSIYRFQDGKVVEYWAFLDAWMLKKQLSK
ncbi:MAG: hypothetical protein Tsb0021_05970 [Chlamydiales bacterium]